MVVKSKRGPKTTHHIRVRGSRVNLGGGLSIPTKMYLVFMSRMKPHWDAMGGVA